MYLKHVCDIIFCQSSILNLLLPCDPLISYIHLSETCLLIRRLQVTIWVNRNSQKYNSRGEKTQRRVSQISRKLTAFTAQNFHEFTNPKRRENFSNIKIAYFKNFNSINLLSLKCLINIALLFEIERKRILNLNVHSLILVLISYM